MSHHGDDLGGGAVEPPAWMIAISEAAGRSRRLLVAAVPAWALLDKQQLVTGSVSFILHLLAAALLTFWVLPPESGLSIPTILAVPVPKEEAETGGVS